MKKNMILILCICSLPLVAQNVQIQQWSRGPLLYREGYKRLYPEEYDSDWIMKEGYSNIWVNHDYLWYGANNDLLYINSFSGLVYRYEGVDQWIPLIEKLTNETIENSGFKDETHRFARLGVQFFFSKEDMSEYIYEVSCVTDKGVTIKEYYKIWQQGEQYVATLLTEKEFEDVNKIPYKNEGKIEQKSGWTVEACSYELDFGYKVYLERAEYAEGEEAWLQIKDRAGNTIYDFRKENENESNRGLCYTIFERAVTVNTLGNTVALLISEFPMGYNQSLVILSIIYDGIINDTRVRLRNEPNLQSQTLGHVNTGDKVQVIDRSNKKQKIEEMEAYWYKVELADGKTGWVYGAYVDVP